MSSRALVVHTGKKARNKKAKSTKLVVQLKRPHVPMNRSLGIKNSIFKRSATGMFRYVDKVTLVSGVAAQVHSFRMNSMFDPDFTGVGHQPLFRDTLSTIFSRFQVNWVEYKFTSLHDNTVAFKWGLFSTQDTGYNPAAQVFETTLEKRGMILWRTCTPNTPNNSISGKIACHAIAAVSKKEYDNERGYSGAVGNNPTIPVFTSIIMQAIDNVSACTQDFVVELNMNCTYYEPFVIAQS